jgi:hypothetical protein
MANTNPRLTANNIKYLTIEGGGGKGKSAPRIISEETFKY